MIGGADYRVCGFTMAGAGERTSVLNETMPRAEQDFTGQRQPGWSSPREALDGI